MGISLPQPGVGADRDRAPQLKTLAPLGEVNGVRWYNLGPTTAAGQTVGGAELVDLPPSFRDFADVAAAIANLDLVISADTVVAHIAGALGKDVWTLVPYSADSRAGWKTAAKLRGTPPCVSSASPPPMTGRPSLQKSPMR